MFRKLWARRPRRLFRAFNTDPRRWEILAVLSAWNRNQSVRIGAAIILAWMAGAVGIHYAERGKNPAFDTLGESFWSAWVLLFSGMEIMPMTPLGRVFAMVLVVAGAGVVGLFTGTVASLLVEAHLRRKDVESMEMEGHLVICNWAPRGLQLIREVHSRLTASKRPVVIIHENPEAVALPATQDESAFNDVYVVKGDCTSEIILRRAKIGRAHSVIVLFDEEGGKHADAKSIITCIAIRNVTRGKDDLNVVVECKNAALAQYLRKAGADEIISSDDLSLRLMARAALFHGMTRVYQELLTVGRDANEMYLIPAPESLIGRDFVELSGLFARHRTSKHSCLLVGVQRGTEMHLNPTGDEAGPLQPGDELILLGRVVLDPTQPLPILPALDAVTL